MAEGLDPRLAKRAGKLATAAAAANTFEAVARELHATKAGSWSPNYAARWIERREKDVFPYLGGLRLPDITAPMVLEVLRKVEKRVPTKPPTRCVKRRVINSE
ncbi:phage integrase central domain-containing protein [Ramlibacter sp. AN1133]|uniref:phage integrase central domain-containing protein n=1 Tax=Ramlibacter sp. AN1133 TaxID=3133429 RepID=UPI0030C3FD87